MQTWSQENPRVKINWEVAFRVCLVGVKTGRMENGERKIGWKMAFSTVWLRKENKRDENMGENFPSGPTFFYPPNLGGKWGGKSAERCTLHKYPQFIHLTYPHFIHLMTWWLLLHPYHFTFTAQQRLGSLLSLSLFFFSFFCLV